MEMKDPSVKRLSLKSWDNTTPQELTRDCPCCSHTRFIDRTGTSALGSKLISHIGVEEFDPE